MVRWKKEKVSRVSRWSLSHNEALGEAGGGRSEEEGARFWPMLTTPTSASLTNRKRARLDGKVVDDCDAVDPSPVPRKLRSAINKCSSQSSSPAIPGAKKKPYDTFNGLQVLHGNGGRRCKQNVLLGSLTEDEKEVLEALCALSRILPIKERIQDDKDREISENHQDNIATPTTHSEAMKEDKNLLQQNTTNGIKSPSFCLEKTLEKPMKDEHAISKQPDTNSGMQTIDSGLSIAPDSGSHITPLSENVHPENIPGNLQSFLSPSGVLPRHCTENRTLQPTQCGSIIAFPPCKSEMLQPNGCVGSAALKHEVQYLKHNSESSTKLVYQKGNVPPHIQLSSCNSAVWPGPATSITSKEVDLPTMKVPLDVTPLWKKCAIHVFISHMIKSYQEKEQQHTLILPSEDSKSRVGSESCELVNNERAGLQSRLKIVASAAIYGSTVERSKHAGTNEISCNRRLVSAHISSVLTEYKQKQSCDFLSLSTNSDTGSTANGVKAPVQLHSPFFHAQVPFPVSHVPYVPAYPEKLVAPATQQVQPQLQHYAGNPFYGPQMNNTIGNSQQQHQQQQICQAHIARYRSPVGIAVLQNDQIHNSLSPSTQLQGFSSLSSKPKPQQQHHHHQLSLHGRRQHKDPHQFQLLYSTSRS